MKYMTLFYAFLFVLLGSCTTSSISIPEKTYTNPCMLILDRSLARYSNHRQLGEYRVVVVGANSIVKDFKGSEDFLLVEGIAPGKGLVSIEVIERKTGEGGVLLANYPVVFQEGFVTILNKTLYTTITERETFDIEYGKYVPKKEVTYWSDILNLTVERKEAIIDAFSTLDEYQSWQMLLMKDLIEN